MRFWYVDSAIVAETREEAIVKFRALLDDESIILVDEYEDSGGEEGDSPNNT